MNKVYKIIWNKAKECYMVASELARGMTKSASGAIVNSELISSKIILALALGVGVWSCSGTSMAIQAGDATSLSAGVAIADVANGVNIESSKLNNVINWSSYNVAGNQTVQYDANNYLNLIGGNNPSQIDGKIVGGGNIYLINPNGVIFGATSSVNVGNLYVSTRAISGNDWATYVDTTTGVLKNTTAVGKDIINLGTITANSVYFEGDTVTFKNSAQMKKGPANNVLRNNDVTIRAKTDIEVGHDKNTGNIVSNLGWTTTDLNGTYKNAKDFILISNLAELQEMRKAPNDNYMLANDIDASPTKDENQNQFWNNGNGFLYVGTYNGTFNGLGHKIKNLYINREQGTGRDASHVSLFGNLGARGVVKNLNMVGCEIHGVEDVAAIVGYVVNGGKIINCTADATCKIYGTEFVGGLVGTTKGGSIIDCVNNAYVDGWNCVGGIVGIADSGEFTLDGCKNYGEVYCHNDPTFSRYGHDWRYENAHVGGLVGYAGDGRYPCIIANSENHGNVTGSMDVGGIAGSFNGGLIGSSTNYGNVNGKSSVGGLVGTCIGGLDYTLIFGNRNEGNVRGTECVGGLVGKLLVGSVQGNSNYGKVTGDYFVDNLIGADWAGYANDSRIENSSNAGSVTATAEKVGQICETNIKNVCNTGAVTVGTIILRDDMLSDSQRLLLIQNDSEEKWRKNLTEKENAEVSPEIVLLENKGIVNGEQLAEMLAADNKQQSEQAEEKGEEI